MLVHELLVVSIAAHLEKHVRQSNAATLVVDLVRLFQPRCGARRACAHMCGNSLGEGRRNPIATCPARTIPCEGEGGEVRSAWP